MAMHEQERRRSPPLETAARTASDVPHPQLLLGLGRIITGRPAGATKATGGGAAGEDERGPEEAPDNVVRSSSPPVAAPLSSAVSSSFRSLLISSPEFQRKSPFEKFQRKPRSRVPRGAAPSQTWGIIKLRPVLPRAAPAKKKPRRKKRAAKKRDDNLCAACGATEETPLWRTWPTDRRIKLCNACGIRARTPGAAMPATTAVAELEQPPPPLEIQPASDSVSSPPEPDSPIFESLLDADIYLLRRTFPIRRAGNAPPPPPPPPAEAEPAPPAPGTDDDDDDQAPQVKKCCLHCATASTRQWRTGPAGEGTLCNPCGVRYRQGRLVPEYRPQASPTFNQAKHSSKHREVLRIRRRQDHPAPAAAYKPVRRTRKRRRNKQQQPAQLRKKPRKGNKEQDQQQPAAQQAAAPAVRKKKSKVTAQRLAPQPALLKKRRREHEHLPPPPPALPHAGVDMVQQHLLPLLQALPNADGENDMEQHLLPPPPPPAQLQAAGGEGELMTMDEPIPPPDPFLFDGPAAPMIIDDDEPVIVIVIDDD